MQLLFGHGEEFVDLHEPLEWLKSLWLDARSTALREVAAVLERLRAATGPVDARRLLRVLNASHNLAYVEWDPAYEFDEVAFCEFFDLARDPWQTHNLCPALDAHLRASLSEELQRWYECRGNRSTPSNCQ